MRTSLAALMLLALAGCGSDSEPDIADPESLRLEIVSGDRQTAPVAGAAQSSGSLAPAAELPEGLLPEPLVARITVDGEAPSASVGTSPLGPSFDVLPSNVVVTFRVPREGCGASFIDSAIPDDSATVTTFWERGTLADDCTLEARLVVDGVPRVDTVFTATFLPGPPVQVRLISWTELTGFRPPPGDTIDLRALLLDGADQHGNAISPATLGETPDSLVSWMWTEAGGGAGDTIYGSTWSVEVPDPGAHGYTAIDFGEGPIYPVFLHLLLAGAGSDYIRLNIPMD